MQYQRWLDPQFVKEVLAAKEDPRAREAFIRQQVGANVAPPPDNMFEQVRSLFKEQAK